MSIDSAKTRSGAHTDYGALTILLAEKALGGLQVKLRNGGWVDVEPKPNSFIINIGDLMAMWTNDYGSRTCTASAIRAMPGQSTAPPVGRGISPMPTTTPGPLHSDMHVGDRWRKTLAGARRRASRRQGQECRSRSRDASAANDWALAVLRF